MVTIVQYKGVFFVHFSNTAAGKAKLLTTSGTVFSGTPEVSKLTVVKQLTTKSFNGHEYFKTKIGIFSCSTGHKICDSNITGLFN